MSPPSDIEQKNDITTSSQSICGWNEGTVLLVTGLLFIVATIVTVVLLLVMPRSNTVLENALSATEAPSQSPTPTVHQPLDQQTFRHSLHHRPYTRTAYPNKAPSVFTSSPVTVEPFERYFQWLWTGRTMCWLPEENEEKSYYVSVIPIYVFQLIQFRYVTQLNQITQRPFFLG